MSEIFLQKQSKTLIPYRPEDDELLAELKDNQVSVWKLVSKGARKSRSFKQLSLVMAALRVVVANTENPNWDTVPKAKLSLKVALGYIDTDSAVVSPSGQVILNYRSFSYRDLGHMAACKLFDRAFPILANVIRVDEEDLIEMAMERNY
jgi:hypothetical protein